ncbi:MAG: homoserine dehydrogenase [Christensenellales bacterium]|jgi:homoserine dehydrogenase
MKVGLLGAGTIGFGVCELAKTASGIEIAKVLDRREIPGLEGLLTRDICDILADPEIDAVVELLGGAEPAHTWAAMAMNAGKHFVTANKLMLSEHLPELMAIAEKNGVSIRFSAAVGGGIPFLFNLLRARRADEIAEVGGILNGTTNYMLDLMQTQKIAYEKALSLAQEAGYAEQDAAADVSGADAQCKIALSASIAWDGFVDKNQVLCEGIERVTPLDMKIAASRDYAVKLLARAGKAAGGICAYVEPTLIPTDSVLANIRMVENAAFLRGMNAGVQRFTGAGAGRYATAYAVISDLIDIDRNAHAYPFTISDARIPVDNGGEAHRYYVRGMEVAGGEEIAAGAYVTPEMPVERMHRLARAARADGRRVFFAGIWD